MGTGNSSPLLRSAVAFAFVLATTIAALPLSAATISSPNLPRQQAQNQAGARHAVSRLASFVQGTAATGSFVGTFTVTSFSAVNGLLMANGELSGSLLDASGNVIATVDPPVSAPVTSASGTCQVLNLTLGAIDLSLNGAAVHLNPIGLTVTGQNGSGNEVGTLLCDVSSLLSSATSAVSAVTGLLNQILSALGGL